MKKIINLLLFAVSVLSLLFAFASCNSIEKASDDAPHIHSFGDWETKTAPTCAELGEWVRLCDCGAAQSQKIPAIGHAYINGTCCLCAEAAANGDSASMGTSAEITPEDDKDGADEKCPHTEITIELVEGKAPTCFTDGLTYGVKCLDCNDMLVPQEIIPASHTYDGLVCKICGKIEKENLTFDSDSTIFFVMSSSASDFIETFVGSLCSSLYQLNLMPLYVTDINSPEEQEIVVGDCDRAVSALLYERLDEREAVEGEMLFAAYSDGKSIAIAYDGPAKYESYLLTFAEDSFFELCVNDEGEISILADELFVVTTDADEYVSKFEEVERQKAWAKFESINGIESTNALKSLYSLYSVDTVTWLANLYDAEIGGFYYSNSARDTAGYLPDLQSTAQALNTLSTTGMVQSMSDLKRELPESMQKQLIYFAKSLQDPNGYFYHPQWSRELVDSNLSRRARDLSWATNILEYFGASPTYDTPYGMVGDGIMADGTPVSVSALTAPIGGSAVLAVSKVISASEVYPPHLQSVEAFREYLDSLDLERSPYRVANELSAQNPQIRQAGLGNVLIEWLNERQYIETGLWGASGDVSQETVNATLKISQIYTNLGYAIPNSGVLINTVAYFICFDTEPTTVVDVYNPWYLVRSIIQNVRSYGYYDDVSTIEEVVNEKLKANAPELMEKTEANLRKYLKADGSFSYFEDHTSPTSSGVPVAVPDVNEGDVNSTVIAVATLNMVKDVLGYGNAPTLFGEAEFSAFLEIIEAQ